jgi:hypothetical protein
MTEKKTTVVNVQQGDDYDVYIGREVKDWGLAGSKWGNPFLMRDESDAERARAIAEFREYITNGDGQHLLDDLHELKGKRLGCWCAPKDCHGHVLAELVESLDND